MLTPGGRSRVMGRVSRRPGPSGLCICTTAAYVRFGIGQSRPPRPRLPHSRSPMDACTLGDLLDVIGGPSLRLHTAPTGLAAPVTEALLYDAHAPMPHAPGALLLAVGVRATAAGPL